MEEWTWRGSNKRRWRFPLTHPGLIDLQQIQKIWWDLDITGNGVRDQLDGGDEKTTGKQKAHRDLVVEPEHKRVRRIRFHLKICWLTISRIRVYLPWRHSSAPQTRSLGTSSCCRLLVLQTRSQNHLEGDKMRKWSVVYSLLSSSSPYPSRSCSKWTTLKDLNPIQHCSYVKCIPFALFGQDVTDVEKDFVWQPWRRTTHYTENSLNPDIDLQHLW